MNIKEAVKALDEGKTIHCPNSFETLKASDDDLGKRVTATRVIESGAEEQQIMYLTRFEQLYKHCVFGLGPMKSTEAKPAEPAVTK